MGLCGHTCEHVFHLFYMEGCQPGHTNPFPFLGVGRSGWFTTETSKSIKSSAGIEPETTRSEVIKVSWFTHLFPEGSIRMQFSRFHVILSAGLVHQRAYSSCWWMIALIRQGMAPSARRNTFWTHRGCGWETRTGGVCSFRMAGSSEVLLIEVHVA